MNYALEDMARILKRAREGKGLSQRALGKLSGIPQGQISKIENGAVDLRFSSLLSIARALDLELLLVPRKALTAVKSVIRSADTTGRYSRDDYDLDLIPYIRQIEKVTKDGQNTETASLNRTLRDLQHFRISEADIKYLQSVLRKIIRQLSDTRSPGLEVRGAIKSIKQLRNKYAHMDVIDDRELPRPAYRLDNSNNG